MPGAHEGLRGPQIRTTGDLRGARPTPLVFVQLKQLDLRHAGRQTLGKHVSCQGDCGDLEVGQYRDYKYIKLLCTKSCSALRSTSNKTPGGLASFRIFSLLVAFQHAGQQRDGPDLGRRSQTLKPKP